MVKKTPTKTINPIHFEDLDPHRFEDLIRQLIYDFKEWQTIEALGRSGNEKGFDIRAYEKLVEPSVNDEMEGHDPLFHPMDGNAWMIQCKREKTIGPAKIVKILEDVDKNDPPYGYILAASTHFSKESHDIFRQILVEKGVMEFMLWGKDNLEDMIYQPKNDRILFSFFGISLTSRRKSRTTEVRAGILAKNKLFRILGREDTDKTDLLLRDINDVHYPKSKNYEDFELYPRWEEYTAIKYGSSGLWVQQHEYLACYDEKTTEWDFADGYDLTYRDDKSIQFDDGYFKRYHGKLNPVKQFWESLPNSKKLKYLRWGLIRFEDILIIDEIGDKFHNCPHIYADFKPGKGPFSRFMNFLVTDHEHVNLEEEKYSRIQVFPHRFQDVFVGTVYRDQSLVLDEASFKEFQNSNSRFTVIVDKGNKYQFLQTGDIIRLSDGKSLSGDNNFIRITHRVKARLQDYLSENRSNYFLESAIKQQLGTDSDPDKAFSFLEFKKVYPQDFESK